MASTSLLTLERRLFDRACQYVPANVFAGIAILFTAWFCWRLWKFEVARLVRPHEPRVLPYTFPWIGHTYSFLRNPEKLINYGYHYFVGDEPFSLVIAGKRTVVIRSVHDISAVWRNTKDLSFEPFVEGVFGAFGIHPETTRKVYADAHTEMSEEAKLKSVMINKNPYNKGYIDLERDWFREELLVPANLQRVYDKYFEFLEEVFDWSNFSKNYQGYILSENEKEGYKVMSLRGFARHSISFCSTSAFFGHQLLACSPDFQKDYYEFEDESWKIFYRFPKMFVRNAHAAKDRALDNLERYLMLPPADRDELSPLFHTMVSELGYLGVNSRDTAGIVMIIIWAINNNAHKTAFWILGHLFHDPAYLAALRAETDKAFSSPDSNVANIDVLLKQCPHLDGVWYEAMRMYNATQLIREAQAPCNVRGTQIRLGDQIIGPFRHYHMSEAIFGPDYACWYPQRWMQNPGLARVKGYAPFGGGHTYCPGRLFAQREIYLFVAVTLWRFDFELEPGQRAKGMCKVDPNRPSASSISPAGDVRVKISPRKH